MSVSLTHFSNPLQFRGAFGGRGHAGFGQMSCTAVFQQQIELIYQRDHIQVRIRSSSPTYGSYTENLRDGKNCISIT